MEVTVFYSGLDYVACHDYSAGSTILASLRFKNTSSKDYRASHFTVSDELLQYETFCGLHVGPNNLTYISYIHERAR